MFFLYGGLFYYEYFHVPKPSFNNRFCFREPLVHIYGLCEPFANWDRWDTHACFFSPALASNINKQIRAPDA